MEATSLKITCPGEPDMEGSWNKDEIETEILEVTGRAAAAGEWIEWVLFHVDVGDYFSDEVRDAVAMPEFRKGTFVIGGVRFDFEKE